MDDAELDQVRLENTASLKQCRSLPESRSERLASSSSRRNEEGPPAEAVAPAKPVLSRRSKWHPTTMGGILDEETKLTPLPPADSKKVRARTPSDAHPRC